jgi:hypothetical protein
MQSAYAGLWKGVKTTMSQALDWPRAGVFLDGHELPDDEVPKAVQRACAELAVRASQAGTDGLDPDVGAQVKSEKVDVIEIVYEDGARQSTKYAAVDRMLAQFLIGGGGQIPVYRA